MTYTITTERLDAKRVQVVAQVLDDQGVEILTGETIVLTPDDAVAYAYGEFPFLFDLRANDDRLAGLVLPCDTPPDRPVEPEPDPGV